MGYTLTWVSKIQNQITLSTIEAEYIALSQSMVEIIAIREVIHATHTFVIEGKPKLIQFSTHAKELNLDKIPQFIVHEDNELYLKFTTMPKMSPQTKHITIYYCFFRSKIEELEMKDVAISTHDQLSDKFIKGFT